MMDEKGESPIEIGRLQRYAVDYVLDNKIQLFSAGAPNGKRVACIGSGPASLACAAELAKWGYEVTVFDRNELPGGLNSYGIAAYKSRASDSIRPFRPSRRHPRKEIRWDTRARSCVPEYSRSGFRGPIRADCRWKFS